MKKPARIGTVTVLTAGFSVLIALIGFMGMSTIREADRIHLEIASIHDDYRQIAAHLSSIESEIHLSGIIVRDCLMDSVPSRNAQYRTELVELRTSVEARLADISRLGSPLQVSALDHLRDELSQYWNSLEPLFSWTSEERTALSRSFLQREALPRRMAVIAMTREINRLSAATLLEGESRSVRSREQYKTFLKRMVAVTFILAVFVAGLSILTIYHLTRHSDRARVRAESAERELRGLSQKLVLAQEEERKAISRELHDEIGQTLTALRIELGNLEKVRQGLDQQFLRRIRESKALAADALNTVRDLAQGLRPSMLDDLGLGPALEWQARDFSRRTGVPATVQLDGYLGDLPENIRTCVYRIAQESLTNCTRHAKARNIRIAVYGGREKLLMTVQDDGIGFDPARAHARGLGLIGIEERVRDLGGSATIQSQQGKGTLIKVELPLQREPAA